MARLGDVCRYARSKNAGPFWVTIDLFFNDAESYRRHRDDAAISAGAIAAVYGVDPTLVKRFAVDDLAVVKLSFPRAQPQGGVCERDMHAGQMYVRLLDLQLG